jgi:hypothetical protein
MTRWIYYFNVPPKAQAHRLDVTGRTPLEDDTSIAMERVQGETEELYWDEIPENVRRHAADRAVKAQLCSGAESSESASNNTHRNDVNGSGSGEKKRTRAF